MKQLTTSEKITNIEAAIEVGSNFVGEIIYNVFIRVPKWIVRQVKEIF